MNETNQVANESRWKPYVKALVFLLPALALWQLARVFLFPKLEIIWRDGGGPATEAQAVMDTVVFLMQHATSILMAVTIALLILDFAVQRWARYRRAAVASVAFLFNAAILFGFAAMCMAALLIAPALAQLK